MSSVVVGRWLYCIDRLFQTLEASTEHAWSSKVDRWMVEAVSVVVEEQRWQQLGRQPFVECTQRDTTTPWRWDMQRYYGMHDATWSAARPVTNEDGGENSLKTIRVSWQRRRGPTVSFPEDAWKHRPTLTARTRVTVRRDVKESLAVTVLSALWCSSAGNVAMTPRTR